VARDPKFWRDVRVGVVIGIILLPLSGLVTWLLGWWPAVRHGLWVIVAAVWQGLIFSTAVPLSAIALLLAAIVIATTALRRAHKRVEFLTAELTRPAPGLGQPEPRELVLPMRFRPNELQEAILRILAALDGQMIHPAHLQQRANSSRLLVEQALRALEGQDFVWQHRAGYGGQPGVGLTVRGQEYVIEAGYVLQRPG
jgi:hypothetical protein